MGSPIAPIIAGLFMEYFETEIRLSIRGPQPSFWARYIDDILLQWAYSIEEFNIFLRKLTQAENLINFQVEWESASSPHIATMPFLDLNITRSPQGLSFAVYRKVTHTDLYTHFYSAHPTATKRGTLISLFLRAHRLCSPEHLQQEIEHIRASFHRVKYPDFFIKEALTTAISRFNNPTPREYQKAKYHLPLLYTPELLALRTPLARIGVSTSFSSRNTLGNEL